MHHEAPHRKCWHGRGCFGWPYGGAEWLMTLVLATAGVGLGLMVFAAVGSGSSGSAPAGTSQAPIRPTAPSPLTHKPSRRPIVAVGPPSDRTHLVLRKVIGGQISPKSVASSGTGIVLAQNMMYRHTVTVYSARSFRLVKTISDAVRLSKLGYPQFHGWARGAPVEA